MFSIPKRLLLRDPCCTAILHGSDLYPEICGTVLFFDVCQGTVIFSEINGLPAKNGFFAMHIHMGRTCSGNTKDPFANAGTHLDLHDMPHPFHTGDLPALLGNNGYAWSAVYTDRFRPSQVCGHTVILHAHSDDYHTQPSGNSGEKIACGIIAS